jgi:hypothetical protein
VLDYQLDGADFVQGCDCAAGDDSEVRGEACDGDEAKVGTACEELFGAEGWLGVVKGVVFSERVGKRRVFEVPHEGSGVEEVDGGYADGIG